MDAWKVLIADDEDTILQGLQLLYPWEENGFCIAGTAQDGQEALDVAASILPHLVLMDINMPKCNGLDTIEKMKRIVPDAYFIIISGYEDFQYAQRALQLGTMDYLLKPVSEDVLAASIFAIRQRLEKQQKGPAAEKGRTIDQMLAYIEENLDKNLSLRDLAERFHMNPGYVSQYFKKKTQMTFLTYCMQRKIDRAQVLLSTTDKSITEIAYELGFANYRTFSKLFKQYTGILPSRYAR